jgi:uncharacterized protein with FMN-binding domain
MDEQSVRGRVGVGQAAARGFVATALTLSLVPSLAYASPETKEETSGATNTQEISSQNEAETASNNNYTLISLAAANSSYTYDLAKIADGTYTGTATADSNDPLNKGDEWDAESYEVSVSVTVSSGKITKVEVGDYSSLGDDDWDRMDKAVNGYTKKGSTYTGVVSQIEANGSTGDVDTVSTATISANAILEAANSALQVAYDDQNKQAVVDEYTYGYASLTWEEYWAAEDVYNATDTSSSSDSDRDAGNGVYEYDKGGYDVVTRATANHGLHRGSFQSTDVIETSEGVEISPLYYPSKTSFVDTEGNSWTISGKTVTDANGNSYTITGHKVTGTKYVPVKVKTSDLDAFKSKYTFYANGSKLQGGYSEGVLNAYYEDSALVAEVDADTNGLKTVIANSDGSFSFSAAVEGTGSGIQGQSLKQATDITPTVVRTTDADTNNEDTFHTGSFGEFLRVDLNGSGYGALGSNMQSVTWEYYGNTSDGSEPAADAEPLATYGTKFAADNWMHKSMGIQLGLTESARCQLPEGTDGTGYWKLTVHALGYEDYTYTFQATSSNIYTAPTPVTEETKQRLSDLVTKAKALNKGSYSAESWSASSIETELQESEDLLANADATEAAVSEQVTHLQNAIDALVKIAPEAGDYILVNIPYSSFYASETGSNAISVDVFTSATKNKAQGSLAAGSYHQTDAASGNVLVEGVTFPVKVTAEAAASVDWSVFTQAESQDALFAAADYSYIYLEEAPASYKEMGVSGTTATFSETKGTAATAIDGTDGSFTTESTYGDYELDYSSDSAVYQALQNSTIYAVVVNTTDGYGYGMRHLENIWKAERKGVFELAWCTGFTDTVHGCPTSSEHYASMMGKTLKDFTVYSSAGTYTVSLGSDGIYVPIKSTDVAIDAQDDAVSLDTEGPTVSVAANLPDDFDAKYTIDDVEVTAKASEARAAKTLEFDAASLKPGEHTIVASDASGKYATVSDTFLASTNKAVAEYSADSKAIEKVSAASEEDLSNFLSNVSTVAVNGTDYSAQGRGAAKIITTAGAINTDAASGMGDAAKKVFSGYGTYTMKVSSAGYPDLEFTFNYEADKSALNSAIENASRLTESDYSQESWKALQDAVSAGKTVAANVAATDEEVASAAQAITDAQAALAASPRISLSELVAKAQALTEADYTKASWSALDSAVSAAEAVQQNAQATDAQVTSAKDALANAMANLVEAASADQKTSLKVEIGKADALEESDYTAESWAKYQEALKAAVAVVNGEDLSASEVQAALESLSNARKGLVETIDEQNGSQQSGTGQSGAEQNTTEQGGAVQNDADQGSGEQNGSVQTAASSSAKTGDSTLGFVGLFGAIAAAAAGAAAWARRRITGK